MHPLLNRILVGSPYRQTLSKYAKGIDRYLGVATVLSASFLGLAVASPIGASDDFFGIKGPFNLFDGIVDLMKTGYGSYALAGGVLFIALPILNISTAFDLWYKHGLDSDKFDKFSRRASACGRLWFILITGCVVFVYKLNTSTGGIVYPPIYFLLVSIGLQKFVLTRMSRMAALVQVIEDDGN